MTVGSELDTRHGEVRLIVARDSHGTTDTSMVSGGLFIVGQSRGSPPVTSFSLSEPLGGWARHATVVAPRGDIRRRHIKVKEVTGKPELHGSGRVSRAGAKFD